MSIAGIGTPLLAHLDECFGIVRSGLYTARRIPILRQAPRRTIDDLRAIVSYERAEFGSLWPHLGQDIRLTDIVPIDHPMVESVRVLFTTEPQPTDFFDHCTRRLIQKLVRLSRVKELEREYAAMRLRFGKKQWTVLYTSNHRDHCFPDDYQSYYFIRNKLVIQILTNRALNNGTL